MRIFGELLKPLQANACRLFGITGAQVSRGAFEKSLLSICLVDGVLLSVWAG